MEGSSLIFVLFWGGNKAMRIFSTLSMLPRGGKIDTERGARPKSKAQAYSAYVKRRERR